MTEVGWLDAEEQRAWRAVITTAVMLVRELNRDLLEAHDLSLDDYAILAMLSEAPDDRLRFGELAQVLRVPKAHITYRFQRLERRGLVIREQCESDGRGAYARLTAAGRSEVEAAAPAHVGSVRAHLLDRLDRDQLLEVGAALERVVCTDDGARTRP